MVPTVPFGDQHLVVGREREQDQLRDCLAGALDGQGSLVLVSGEAGIGKTTLVRLLAAEAAKHQVLVLTGHCYELTTPPAYGPWTDLADNYPWHEGLLPPAALLDTNAANLESQTALFQETRNFLSTLAARNPVILVLEDLHWSDATSLELLRFVARTIDRLSLLLIATYRSDELEPGHRLFQLLPSLVRETGATRIALQRLADAAVHSLVAVQYQLASADEHRLASYLRDHAEGNPLYLRELLHTLIGEKILTKSTGAWMLGDLDRIVMPPLIHQLIEGRFARLGKDTRDLLTIAAVIGQDVSLDLWSEISGVSDAELDCVIQEALDTHILQESPDGAGYRFSHALIREAVYAGLTLTRRREWHRRVAEALIESAHADPETVAHHFQQASDSRAARWQVEAGERAQALYAPQSAIEHFTRALDVPDGLATAERIRAHRGRGQAHDTEGDYLAAREDHEAALHLARDAGDREAEWQALLDLGLVWASRDYDETGAYWQQALDVARDMDNASTLAASLNWVGNWHVNIEQPFEALRYHHEALAIYQGLGDRRGIAETTDFLGMAAMLSGDLVASAAHYRQAVMLLEDLGDRQRLSSSLVNLQADSAAAMNMCTPPGLTLPEGQQAAERALATARDIGWRSGEAFGLTHLGSNLAAQGNYGEAQRALRTGLAIAEEIGHHQWTAIALWTLGASYLDLFAYAEARIYLERSLTLCKHVNSRFMARCASAYLALAYGRQGLLDDASRVLSEELDRAADPPTVAQRIQWTAEAELALDRERPDEALRIIDWLTAPAPPRPGGHIPITLSLLRGRALTAMRRLREAESELQAARAGALGQGANAWLHAIHLAFIQLFQLQGRSQDAARELAAAHTNVSTRAQTIEDTTLRERYLKHASGQLNQLVDRSAVILSRREIQVLLLVAEGLTDAEVAERLFISPRTVSQHLRSVYTKLDVPSRAAATRVALERGIL